jgi:SIS domain-containing protein
VFLTTMAFARVSTSARRARCGSAGRSTLVASRSSSRRPGSRPGSRCRMCRVSGWWPSGAARWPTWPTSHQEGHRKPRGERGAARLVPHPRCRRPHLAGPEGVPARHAQRALRRTLSAVRAAPARPGFPPDDPEHRRPSRALLEISDRDVAVGISSERYAKISLELFDVCADRSATGIAITDKASSPMTRTGALVLRCQSAILTVVPRYQRRWRGSTPRCWPRTWPAATRGGSGRPWCRCSTGARVLLLDLDAHFGNGMAVFFPGS